MFSRDQISIRITPCQETCLCSVLNISSTVSTLLVSGKMFVCELQWCSSICLYMTIYCWSLVKCLYMTIYCWSLVKCLYMTIYCWSLVKCLSVNFSGVPVYDHLLLINVLDEHTSPSLVPRPCASPLLSPLLSFQGVCHLQYCTCMQQNAEWGGGRNVAINHDSCASPPPPPPPPPCTHPHTHPHPHTNRLWNVELPTLQTWTQKDH